MPPSLIEKVTKPYLKKRPFFTVGDKISVTLKLKEGDKERLQVFKGIVISKRPRSGKGTHATFTVRKISSGVGVERIFHIHSPIIEKIDLESSSHVRRSKLYFLRKLKGKKARLKESDEFSEFILPEEEPVEPTEAETVEALPQATPQEKVDPKTPQ